MAFDHPLEADKVDDLGLFSTFVRAPIVGVIMWAIGGDEAKKLDVLEQQNALREKFGVDDRESEFKPIDATQLQLMIEQNRNRKSGKKKMPNLIGSDLSDFGELVISQENTDVDDADREDCDYGGGLKRTKKMSWSDESGQDLCEVIDETSATHEPQHNIASSLVAVQPIKSSVKRSRSMRMVNGSLNVPAGNDPSLRFIPKGLSAGHGGIIYPTHPNAQSKTAPGYVSPDGWGWYITTTPPTPDMYHHTSKQAKKTTIHNSATSRRPTTLANPAFKTGSQKTAVGWPSVPL